MVVRYLRPGPGFEHVIMPGFRTLWLLVPKRI